MKQYNVTEKYETPCMEVDYFEVQDVILTSDPDIGENPDVPEL